MIPSGVLWRESVRMVLLPPVAALYGVVLLGLLRLYWCGASEVSLTPSSHGRRTWVLPPPPSRDCYMPAPTAQVSRPSSPTPAPQPSGIWGPPLAATAATPWLVFPSFFLRQRGCAGGVRGAPYTISATEVLLSDLGVVLMLRMTQGRCCGQSASAPWLSTPPSSGGGPSPPCCCSRCGRQ